MKVLLTGARGMLGGALQASRPEAVTCVGVDVDEMDVTDPGAVTAVVTAERPHVILNCAAYTAVDACEDHEDEALAVNGTAVGHVGRAARGIGAGVLHVSTDYVFDGALEPPATYDVDDPVSPISAYGRTKLAGERALHEATDSHWIVRTQWLYGPGGSNFVETMLGLAAERDSLAVVDDQVGSPTSVDSIAPFLWRMILERVPYGTYHLTNAGECSWYDFAAEIFRRAGVAIDLRRTDSATFVRPAPRPARAVLDNGRIRAELGEVPEPWTSALGRYMERRAAAGAGRT